MKMYDNPQAPVGTIVPGEFLKEMISREFFPVSGVTIDGEHIAASEIDFSEIEDKEYFAVLQNSNCGIVEFVQMFTDKRIFIHTENLSPTWNR